MPKKKARHDHKWVYVSPEGLETSFTHGGAFYGNVAWCKKCGVCRCKDGAGNVVFRRPTGDS